MWADGELEVWSSNLPSPSFLIPARLGATPRLQGALASMAPQPSPSVCVSWVRAPHPGPLPVLAQDLFPESVSYVLGTQGHNFTLHLMKNR